MALSNVEVVRGVVDAFNEHDADRLTRWIAPDGEADWSESIAPYRGVYRGREEWREFLEIRLDAWRQVHWEVVELVELDAERVLSVVRLIGQGRDSGVEVTASAAIVWTISAGQVLRAKLFQSMAEALAALEPGT